jgi:hypothetical protein
MRQVGSALFAVDAPGEITSRSAKVLRFSNAAAMIEAVV